MSPDGRTLAFLRDEDRGDIVSSAALYLATPAEDQPWSMEAVESAATRYAGFGSLRFVEGVLAFAPDGKLGVAAVGMTLNNPAAGGWQFWIVPITGGPPSPRLDWMKDEASPRVSSFNVRGRQAVRAPEHFQYTTASRHLTPPNSCTASGGP